MNDRFKFRFYHYETETMYEVKAICFEGRPIVTVQYNPVLKFPLDSGELMQCTGLKDKNGKLAFEGDIVQTEDQTIGAVKFGEYGGDSWEGWHFGFYIDWIKNRQFKRKPTLRKDFWFWIENRELEVIGNVHENEGLLK